MCACACVYELVVPSGETIANSRKWIGMEDLARDSGVKMKEFFHTLAHARTHANTHTRQTLPLTSLPVSFPSPSLSASGCTLYLCHLGFRNTCSHANVGPQYAQPHAHARASSPTQSSDWPPQKGKYQCCDVSRKCSEVFRIVTFYFVSNN